MINEILGGEITIEFNEDGHLGHYSITPYTFEPKIGHKLSSNKYLDMGQGLLECMKEVHDQVATDQAETIVQVD